MGLIWVLISRMPSLANLSPLCKHKSRSVISVVENSACSARPASKFPCWMLGPVVRRLSRSKYIILCESRGERACLNFPCRKEVPVSHH